MNIRDSKEHLDKLRRLALTKNNDLVNQFKLDLDKIQNDNTLSIDLKGFMEFGYNFMIDFCDVLSPFYQIAFQIWMHSDSILENEKLSDKYDGDLNEETYQKLQSFPYEKRKKYLQRYFQNGTYDRIAKTVIGFQPNMKDFEDVLYALSTSKEDNEAVILFKRNIKRDYIRFQQIRKCAEYLALLSEGKKDFDEADEQFCLHHAQSIGSQLIDDPNLLDNEMQELQKTLQTITFCKTACNGLEGLLELQKKIEKKGMHDCIEYLTMFLVRGLFTPAMDMFIRSQPTIAEENIVLDLFHGSKYEDILKNLKSYYAHTMEGASQKTLIFKEGDFCIDDIICIRSCGDYITIYSSIYNNSHNVPKKETVTSSLKGVLEKLPQESFCQVHKSWIVAIKKIREVKGGKIYIKEGIKDIESIPVGGKYKQSFKKLWEELARLKGFVN